VLDTLYTYKISNTNMKKKVFVEKMKQFYKEELLKELNEIL